MNRNPRIPAVLLSGIHPIGTDQDRSLSLVQQRLWHEHQRNPSIAGHVIVELQLQGELNRLALLSAMNRIVARHEVLRATFRSTEEGQVVVIGPVDSGFALAEKTVQSERAVAELRRYEEVDPFDLSTGPLIRGQLLQISRDEHVYCSSRSTRLCRIAHPSKCCSGSWWSSIPLLAADGAIR
jgi:hypothetical protein